MIHVPPSHNPGDHSHRLALRVPRLGDVGGPRRPELQAAIDERHGQVVKARLTGASWKKVGLATGYNPKVASRIFVKVQRQTRGVTDIEEYRAGLLHIVEDLIENFAPLALGKPPPAHDWVPPDPHAATIILSGVHELAGLVGAHAPKQSEVKFGGEVNEGAMERAQRLRDVIDKLQGTQFAHQPPRPEPLDESYGINESDGHSNGHAGLGPWARVVQLTRDEEDPHAHLN